MGESGDVFKPVAGPPVLEFSVLYRQIRVIAARQLQAERSNHTLPATSLANEAFLRLSTDPNLDLDRSAFLTFVSRAMRQVLVDYARARGASKRGSGAHRITLQESHRVLSQNIDVEVLHEAL